jgi:hypothetical protein
VFDIGFGDRINCPGSERDEKRAKRPNLRRTPVELIADCESTMAVGQLSEVGLRVAQDRRFPERPGQKLIAMVIGDVNDLRVDLAFWTLRLGEWMLILLASDLNTLRILAVPIARRRIMKSYARNLSR